MCKCAFKVGCVSALADWQNVSIEHHKNWMDGWMWIHTDKSMATCSTL